MMEMLLRANDMVEKWYIMALFDGRSHQFSHDLYQSERQGGVQAAQKLDEAIRQHILHLPMHNSSQCRIVARVFIDLERLSKLSKRTELTSVGPVELAAFGAAFSGSRPWFDWINVTNEQELRAKIIASYKLAIDDYQCHHVFLGASGHPDYLDVLSTNAAKQWKTTLIHSNYDAFILQNLSISSIKIPGLFEQKKISLRTREEDTKFLESLRTFCPCAGKSLSSEPFLIDSAGSPVQVQASRNVPEESNIPTHHDRTPLKDSAFHMSTELPLYPEPGMFPLNVQGQRLDVYIRPPTRRQWYHYDSRQRNPCNMHHLIGNCDNIECQYDHAPLDSTTLFVLRYVQMTFPCAKKGKCRNIQCYKGHDCQRRACCDGMISKQCKMSDDMHNIDKTVAFWTTQDRSRTLPAANVPGKVKRPMVSKDRVRFATLQTKEQDGRKGAQKAAANDDDKMFEQWNSEDKESNRLIDL